MSRGMSKAQKASAYDGLGRQLSLTELALHDVLNDHVTWGQWFTDSDAGGKVQCGISRIDGAMGGILISRWRSSQNKQGDMINVEFFEGGKQRIHEGRVYCCESYLSLYDALSSAESECAIHGIRESVKGTY